MRTSTIRSVRGTLLIAAVALGLAALPAQAAAKQVSQAVAVPVSVDIGLTSLTCDNTGSTVDVTTSLTLGGMSANIVYKNNTRGTKVVTVGTASFGVAPVVEKDIPKQPVGVKAGGNPYVSVALASADGRTLLSEPVIVGRCVQGLLTDARSTVSARLPASASALFQALECTSRGSRVTLDADRTEGGGLSAVVLFDNNKNKVVHRAQATAEAVLALTGGSTHKGWGQDEGAGGNPLVYLSFADGVNAPVEHLLGRCKDLL